MGKENLYELSNEAREAAKRTAWPVESLQDAYAFGYETAKDIYQFRIASLEAQLAEANKKLSWYQSGEIHTCHADCQRPFCVLHRQLESARGVIVSWIDFEDRSIAKEGPYVGMEINSLISNAKKWLEDNKK